MTSTATDPHPSDDDLTGGDLKRRLARALRRQKIRALLLIAPLLLFILLGFIAPIGSMLFRSVENNIVGDIMPNTVAALQSWDVDSTELPPEAVFRAVVQDVQVAAQERTAMQLARRMNFEVPGFTTLMRQTQRAVRGWNVETDGPFRDQLIAANHDWGDLHTWRALKAYSTEYTAGYYLAAVDHTMVSGHVEALPDNQSIHMMLFWRTAWMSALICFMTLLLGYPVAFLLANVKERYANLLLIMVLLPFWTSLLVRTSSWKVLLQEQGVINDFLVWLGLVADDSRLSMINNKFGVIVAMTHILLPFMVLPLYSVMKTVPPSYVRAAKSLGANDWTAFWRVYFPQSVPGIGAGAILVFIMAVGYYITPELVGGPSGMFISNRIAHQWYVSGNWGLVGALGTILLVAVLVLYWVYDRVVGIDNVKLG
ncbi:MAG: ABC transporter permease [Rhodobacter sp.]|uniref:ABC transporter permease n=1 Tax=Pararhodobacter sp. TaxID=2127056 RepID=UPI001DFB54B8|nr:ABC transporter permease [Pararhodobacter sp.]MCB1346017.1 ABC transporter permease [Paracoccaceae bacterium]MCB1408826.1 ABC transporter permease [Paracoccaceae bacterium]MCC0073296.1 ABC transporter permease [Rhodobacter sp.]HPD92652.1 ABC transporter permease [Pararhodobacter sp.]